MRFFHGAGAVAALPPNFYLSNAERQLDPPLPHPQGLGLHQPEGRRVTNFGPNARYGVEHIVQPLPFPSTSASRARSSAKLSISKLHHSGSNLTCSPWYSATSFAQITFIASIRSRIREKRVLKTVPWLAISSAFHPPPTPNTKRPPLR